MHTSRRQFLKTAIGAVAAGSLLACTSKSATTRPNILWITTEDISPALGCYGDTQATTPNIDKLAQKSILFNRAYAPAPICAPSRSCLITGVHATSMGTQHLRSEVIKPDFIKPLPILLREHGYYTSNNAKADYNFNADGIWDDMSSSAHFRKRLREQPFFSVFNYTITHEGNGNNMNPNDTAGLENHHNPDEAQLPPYFPDTPQFRKIWANYYDLITVFDQSVGELLAELEADGLAEDTIIFLTADHGFGLPRYKRWCYDTGMRVPALVCVPPKYQYLVQEKPGSHTDRLLSFVDIVPTMLNLLNIDQPEYLEGQAFLGKHRPADRKFIIGARDRADDVYDMSRVVISQRYVFMHNFMPHRPYITNAIIFGEEKGSFKELLELKAKGLLSAESMKMFNPKPVEELYDLQNDPHELNNIVDDAANAAIVDEMRQQLKNWMLQTKDTGLLHEAEYMRTSSKQQKSVYEITHANKEYDFAAILEAAFLVGDNSKNLAVLQEKMEHSDAGVRFWAFTALLAREKEAKQALPLLKEALTDPSPSVQNTAAEVLCNLGECKAALPILARNLQNTEHPTVILHAARTLANIGTQAAPLLPEIKQARQKVNGTIWNRYASWMYPMFIGMALDQTLLNLGQHIAPRS